MIILGSNSPRRKDLLNFFKLPFTQMGSPFDEASLPFSGDPLEYVQTLAKEKGLAIVKERPKEVILTADTIVVFEGDVYEKPVDQTQAAEFLETLSGNTHEVISALCTSFKGKQHVYYEKTYVTFKKLNSKQIKTYIESVHVLDKAGAYAVQDSGSIIIDKIEGCFYNVMGLPINALEKALKEVGIDLWNYLKPSS